MKITLPLPPNMANARMHWAVKQNKRTAYFEACSIAALLSAKGGEHRPDKWLAPPKAQIRATIYCGGKMDQDNAIARLKWPVDWMTRNGYLRGDTPEKLEWVWPVNQVVKRHQQYRVEFELSASVISGKTEDAK